MSTDFGAIADAAARAVASMFVVLIIGVAFTISGKLDSDGLRAIGVTINWLFVPAIMFDSFGAGLSVETMKTLWVVVVFGVLTAPLSAIVSYPTMVLSKPPDWFRPWFLFGVTFQNTVALPLVLIQTICSQIRAPVRSASGVIQVDSNGTTVWMTTAECTSRGELYIFMFVFLHGLLFWIVAYDMMPSKVVPKNVEQSSLPDAENGGEKLETLDNYADNQLANDVSARSEATTVGDNTRKSFSSAADSSLASMAEINGNSTQGMSMILEGQDPVSLYMSGSLDLVVKQSPRSNRSSLGALRDDYIAGSFYGGVEQIENVRQVVNQTIEQKPKTTLGKLGSGLIWLFFHILSLCARPPIIAQLLGTFIGLIAPLQEAFFSPSSVLRPLTLSIKIFAVASTGVTNLSMAASLGLKMREVPIKHLFGGDPDGLSKRATFGFVVTRMFIVPGVVFGVTYLLQMTKILPNDRLLLLVLYMQAMTPSANMCVVVPQILGNYQASGALSLLVLSQYIVALPSMLLWLSLAFYVTADLL